MHYGLDRHGNCEFNVAFYSNVPHNKFDYLHLHAFRHLHVETVVYVCQTVDREKGDKLNQEDKAIDGPSEAGKAYTRRITFRSDLYGSLYQFGCSTPPYALDVDIHPQKWYLMDSQRFRSFRGFKPESIDICIQFHVDHRNRVKVPRINNAWMYDPNTVEPPESDMEERLPMAATGKHPTDQNYPQSKFVVTSAYIQELHPKSHFNRVMMIRFVQLRKQRQQQEQQQQQQEQQRKDQSAQPLPRSNDNNNNDNQSPQPSDVSSHFYRSSTANRDESTSAVPRYVSIVAISILWYNNID